MTGVFSKRFIHALMILGLCSVLSVNAIAQVNLLEGNWKIETFVEGSELELVTIDAMGNTTCPESIACVLDGQEYNIDLTQKGISQLLEGGVFLYTGGGTATALEDDKVRVVTEAIASGLVSGSSTIIAGVWTENQIYTRQLSTLAIVSATPAPFVMVREDFEIETPGIIIGDIEGEWDFELTGNTLGVSWAGTVFLNTNGTILGMLANSNLPSQYTIPTAGFFTVSDDGVFSVEYTTTVDLPNFGVKTITISGTGEFNEDYTQITGSWSVTINPDEEEPEGTAKTLRVFPAQEVFTGEFSMEKALPEPTPDPLPESLTIEIAYSTFDSDRDNWRIYGDAQDNTFIPFHRSTGGNPGGYIESVDDVLGGTWYWDAPEKFLGDKSNAYAGMLTYELVQSTPGSEQYEDDDVILIGPANLRLAYRFDSPPGKNWTPYMVLLSEGGWRIVGGFRLATKAEVQTVLSSLHGLQIRGEYRNGDDKGGLDNVFLFGLSEGTPVMDWMCY